MKLALGFTLDSESGQNSALRQRWAQVLDVLTQVEGRVRSYVLQARILAATLRSTAQPYNPAHTFSVTALLHNSRCPRHCNKASRCMGPHGGLRFAQASTDEHCVLRAAATCLHPPAIGTGDAVSAGPLFTSGNTSDQVVA